MLRNTRSKLMRILYNTLLNSDRLIGCLYGHVILNRKFHFPRVQWNTFHYTLASAIVLYVLFHCTLFGII
jgi:hypothetical protein